MSPQPWNGQLLPGPRVEAVVPQPNVPIMSPKQRSIGEMTTPIYHKTHSPVHDAARQIILPDPPAPAECIGTQYRESFEKSRLHLRDFGHTRSVIFLLLVAMPALVWRILHLSIHAYHCRCYLVVGQVFARGHRQTHGAAEAIRWVHPHRDAVQPGQFGS
jgi:hypothetical protein